MIKFIDGPAEGIVLALRRAPLFLRVVEVPAFEEGGASKWDALDQLKDFPGMGERVHVYRRNGPAQSVHLCRARASGWYAIAEYVYHERQPDEETGRKRDLWRAWATAEVERLKATAKVSE